MKRKRFFSVLLFATLTLTLLPVISFPAAAAAPTTRAEFIVQYGTVFEQELGTNNLGDSNAHEQVLTLGPYKYQMSSQHGFAAYPDFCTVGAATFDFNIEFTGDDLPKAVCLGVIAANSAGGYQGGQNLTISVNGGADISYVTAESLEDNAFILISDEPVNSIAIKGEEGLWQGLGYILLAENRWATVADTSWYNELSSIFTINTAEQLAGLALLVNEQDKSFAERFITLGADIDLSGASWTPIGTQEKPFKGAFDGGMHKITGLRIGTSGAPVTTIKDAGLFGACKEDFIIRNTEVESEIYTAFPMDSGASTVGGIVGFGYEGVIKNCRASGTLSGTENTRVGGIIGYIYSTYAAVLNCHTRVNAISGSSAGGVVGIAVADIINCYAAGYVEGTYFEGALVGRATGSELINCYWNSDLESTPVNGGNYAGALGLPADVMKGLAAPAEPIVYNTAAGTAEASGNDAFLSALNGGRSVAGDVHSGISAFPWRSDIFDENGGFPVLAMPAPELNLTISPGTVVGTTSVTAPAGDGNHLAYMLTDAPAETPYKNEAVGGVIDYVSGNNITVSAGQYLNVYELNAGSQVIAFKSVQIEEGHICGDTVTISDEAELRAFAADVNVGNSYSGKTVVLTNDIALTEEWTPIGTVDHPFEGVFDGSGYTVSGLFIGSSESPDTTYAVAGLFGLCEQASIKNVTVRVEIFSNNVNPACSIGALVGYSQGGSIQNCRAEGSMTCYNGLFGGIVGTKTNSLVQNCSASVNVTCGDGTSYAGGLVGFNTGNILNCYATGSVTGGNSTYIGGVAGANSYGTIRDCYATCNLTTGNEGGIGGITAGNFGDIRSSFSACKITVSSGTAEYAGALVGIVVDQPDIAVATVDSSYYNSDLNDDLPGIGYNLGSGTVTVTGLTTAEMQGTDALSAGHMSELGANWEVTPGYYPHLKALAVRLTFKEQDDITLATIDFNPGARLTPPDVGERLGFTFDGWFTSDGQEIDFTQPVLLTKDTVLTAGWTADTCTVTFSSDGSVYATKTVNTGESIGDAAWPADPTKSGFTFGGWFTGENGAGTRFTSATAVNSTITVYAKWTYNDGGDNGGGGGGNGGDDRDEGGNTPARPTYNVTFSGTNTSVTSLPVSVNTNTGNATADLGSIPAKDIFTGSGTTVLTVPSIPGLNSFTLEIPADSLSGSQSEGALTFSTPQGSVSIPAGMLAGMPETEGKKAGITIGRGDISNLSDDIKAAIGDRPIVQLTLTLDGKQTDWNNPNAPVTVSIPYTPTAAELANPENIVVWYIDGSGNAVCVPDGRYDPDTGTVTFTTTHFSYYAVSFKQVSFNDVPKNAWYAKAVSFIAAREITTGTGGGNFSPEAKLTRGQFIVMLMKAYGIAPDTNPDPGKNFADAGSTWYTGYLAAAKRLNISAGVGNNLFAPEKEITRQEMFTLLYNALKVIGKLPRSNSGKTLSSFSDADGIAPWAKEAMKLFVETGTISGSGNRLLPEDTTNRAQMAQVLYSLLGK